MNKFSLSSCLAIAFIFVAAIIFSLCSYTVDMTEQVIVTRFGKPVGDTIDTAGLKFKAPFIDVVNRFDKRIMAWDGLANEMPTKDKTYILVDTYARWKIVDARAFFENLRDGKIKEFGIELLDIRFKRINYNETVRQRIYERMISERAQIAELFRSEGAGEAAKILGNMEKELKTIDSAAYKTIQITKGEADAKAISIYAEAYDKDEESRSFFEFTRTMETFENTLSNDSMLILTTDSELFRYLKGLDTEE